jgi:hypothetical protein
MFCAVLLAVFASGAGAQQVVRKLPVALQLDVNGQGQVAAMAFMDPPKGRIGAHGPLMIVPGQQTALPDALANAVKQAASHWRFKGRRVDGHPVSGRTWVHAELQIVERPDHTYATRLLYLRNGPYFYRKDPPRYPSHAIRNGGHAAVVVDALVQPDDTVANVHVVKVYGNVPGDDDDFRQAVEDAVKRWKGHAELIDARAVATHVRVPIFFVLDYTTDAEKERLHELVAQDMQAQGASTLPVRHLQSGEAVALDSPFVKQPSG